MNRISYRLLPRSANVHFVGEYSDFCWLAVQDGYQCLFFLVSTIQLTRNVAEGSMMDLIVVDKFYIHNRIHQPTATIIPSRPYVNTTNLYNEHTSPFIPCLPILVKTYQKSKNFGIFTPIRTFKTLNILMGARIASGCTLTAEGVEWAGQTDWLEQHTTSCLLFRFLWLWLLPLRESRTPRLRTKTLTRRVARRPE